MDCYMNAEEDASYYLNFASTSLVYMKDPGIGLPSQVGTYFSQVLYFILPYPGLLFYSTASHHPGQL